MFSLHGFSVVGAVFLIALPCFEVNLILESVGPKNFFYKAMCGTPLFFILMLLHTKLVIAIVRDSIRSSNYLHRAYTEEQLKEMHMEAIRLGRAKKLYDSEISTVRPVVHIETSKPDKNLKKSPILNLDDVIRRYAWIILYKEAYIMEDNMIKYQKSYTCQVDWAALTFEHKVTKFIPIMVKDGTVFETTRGGIQAGTKWVTLVSCYLDNESDIKQSNTFRGSRDTTTWMEVYLEQCYTVDKQVCVQINLPQIPHFPMDKDIQLCLNEIKGRVFEEIRTWRVNTQVEVEPLSRAHAQLLARQECFAFEFEIRTTLSNPAGKVRVDFKGLYTHRQSVDIENLHEVFQLVEDGGVLKPEEKACVDMMVEKWLDEDGVEHSTTYPQIITRGTCVCLSWTDQRVDIKTSQISLDDYISDGDVSDNKSAGNLMNQDVNGGSYFS
ncbi:uncharacterized protein LOC131952921 [Physella acuta]|uniref:uncharacterized protein LOC131952921 n=1 Tax=Physella acuta TaxID=109671 RepID=UPI0027DB52A8|nr:uncharacterized protein LOC131952921 [Physella acuta]